MAAIPVMISGVLWNHAWRRGEAVTLLGEMSYTDLGIGGGPIFPPVGGGGQPGFPTHPIFLPGEPTHPIVIPPQPPDPPDPTEPKPPPPDGGWGWHPEYGWGYFPGGGGKPQPPGRRG
jgi:hypothetical protein